MGKVKNQTTGNIDSYIEELRKIVKKTDAIVDRIVEDMIAKDTSSVAKLDK